MVYSCTLNPPKPLGITKSIMCEVGSGVPELHLSFVIINVAQEEMISEDTNDDELIQIGTFVLRL